MNYGFDLGRLRSNSVGLSFVDRFLYSGGTENKIYESEAFEFATAAEAILLPQVDVPASTIPVYPTVSVALQVANKRIVVMATGGNVVSNILIFVR
jgi:hypothetical protein